jgi:hypothetical protein
MSISKIGNVGNINKNPSTKASDANSGPDFMDQLKAKFDSALRHLQERNDLPVSGVYSFNNNIYSTINISNSSESTIKPMIV